MHPQENLARFEAQVMHTFRVAMATQAAHHHHHRDFGAMDKASKLPAARVALARGVPHDLRSAERIAQTLFLLRPAVAADDEKHLTMQGLGGLT